MDASKYFLGWGTQNVEDALKSMGCVDSSSLPTEAVKMADLLEDSEAPVTAENCLRSLHSTKFEIFNDPVHGTIELHPLLATIVKMPAFTRLKNIRQLGGVYYVYQGATHTRFEHSIGTCYIAGEFIRMLQRKQPELHITDKEVLCIEVAALCHDLGHGPFSHLFEKDVLRKLKHDHSKQLKNFPEHEQLSTLVFEHHIYQRNTEEFISYGIENEEMRFIKELIDHDFSDAAFKSQKPRRFLYEIVANKCTGIDVDKWDYFARDCQYMGIQAEFNWRRLMTLSRVIKVDGQQRICYRNKEVNSIYGMFRTRCSLHQKAYQHKAVIGAEHMIAYAIDTVKELPLVKPIPRMDQTTEADLISVLQALRWVTQSPSKLEGYLALNDSVVHQILHHKLAKGEEEKHQKNLLKAQTLLQQLDRREKFHLIEIESGVSKLSVTEAEIVECDKELEYDDVYIRYVEISYASERNKDGEKDDPIKETYFYTKVEPWKTIKGDDNDKIKKLDIVRPVKFILKETRLYGSPLKHEQVSVAYKKAKEKKRNMGGSDPKTPVKTESLDTNELEKTPTNGRKSSRDTQVTRKLDLPEEEHH